MKILRQICASKTIVLFLQFKYYVFLPVPCNTMIYQQSHKISTTELKAMQWKVVALFYPTKTICAPVKSITYDIKRSYFI